MHDIPINWLALIAATAAKMVIGAAWYSPALFSRTWMRLAGRSEAELKATMPKALAIDLVGSFLMAFVLVHAIRYAGAATLSQGAAVGFFNWLGFIAVTTLSAAVYERRPFALFLITNGFQLLSLLVMGAILAVWS